MRSGTYTGVMLLLTVFAWCSFSTILSNLGVPQGLAWLCPVIPFAVHRLVSKNPWHIRTATAHDELDRELQELLAKENRKR